MSESKATPKKVVSKKVGKSFAYRCIKKDFTSFGKAKNITPEFHLELGENNEAVIVEDRPTDWFALAQKDADKVGLANILEIARRRGENPYDGRYAFKDEEALDLGDMDAKNPESVKQAIAAGSQAQKKLEATAAQLGVSVDELVDSFVKGTLSALIEKNVKVDEQSEGGNQ